MAKKKQTVKEEQPDAKVWLGRLVAQAEAEAQAAKPAADLEPIEPLEARLPQPEPDHSSWRFYALVGGSSLGVLIIFWLLASIFLLRLSLGPARLPARLSDTALIRSINSASTAYRLAFVYPDGTKKLYPLNQAGLQPDIKATIRRVRQAQSRWPARLKWWQPLPVSLSLNKNMPTLNGFIASSTQIVVQPSADASISINNGTISIANAVTGKQYGLSNPTQTIMARAASLDPRAIKLQTLAVKPALTAQSLEPYKTSLEKILNQPASFTIGGDSITPTPNDIAGWLEITPDDKTRTVSIAVNSGKVLAYIDSIAAPLIHPAKAEVDIQQTDGSSQTLIPGVNGQDVTAKAGVAATVASNLLSAKGFSYALPVNYQPYQTITAQNYPKWIEVDLTSKRLYAYEYTNLVMTDLVTAGAPATPTVTGQYAIYSKFTSQNMYGENVDGSSYYQPNVPWINYFYKDYAIHGNYWRPTSYFGNVNSSHGCVGLRDWDAEWIYNWAPVGTPVIVHT